MGEKVGQIRGPQSHRGKEPIAESNYLDPRIACVYVGDELLGLWYGIAESGKSELLLSLLAAL